ncbi:MAG: hypothetical protein ACQEXJ_13325 [Myxococcota bacterium]
MTLERRLELSRRHVWKATHGRPSGRHVALLQERDATDVPPREARLATLRRYEALA